MFAARFYNPRYFAPRYFARRTQAIVVTYTRDHRAIVPSRRRVLVAPARNRVFGARARVRRLRVNE